MKFLVTGGAGFVGSNIVLRLIEDGYEVVALDDLSLGRLPEDRKVAFVRGDVRDKEKLDSICKDVDSVFHDAAWSSSPMFSPDPREGVDINILGFMNIAEAARKYDFPVVYASTSSLYSRSSPPHREDQPVSPNSFYELSFYGREAVAKLYSNLYGLKLIGLRYFSVYGPGEEHKGKFANNITQFLLDFMSGRSPIIYGDGTQTRDFTFVEDVVEANMLAMKSGLKGEVINVGTGVSTSFNDMLAILKRQLKINMMPNYVPNPVKNYVMHTKADTTKAQRLLNFYAKVSLVEGIRRTVEYHKNKDLTVFANQKSNTPSSAR
jgi:UDP-glucose 4-epimerase